jgi:hypothetical protein
MKKLIVPTIAAFCLAAPTYAGTNAANQPTLGQNGNGSDANGSSTPSGDNSTANAASKDRQDGVSRNKSDCVKTGCVDNGGN